MGFHPFFKSNKRKFTRGKKIKPCKAVQKEAFRNSEVDFNSRLYSTLILASPSKEKRRNSIENKSQVYLMITELNNSNDFVLVMSDRHSPKVC